MIYMHLKDWEVLFFGGLNLYTTLYRLMWFSVFNLQFALLNSFWQEKYCMHELKLH